MESHWLSIHLHVDIAGKHFPDALCPMIRTKLFFPHILKFLKIGANLIWVLEEIGSCTSNIGIFSLWFYDWVRVLATMTLGLDFFGRFQLKVNIQTVVRGGLIILRSEHTNTCHTLGDNREERDVLGIYITACSQVQFKDWKTSVKNRGNSQNTGLWISHGGRLW